MINRDNTYYFLWYKKITVLTPGDVLIHMIKFIHLKVVNDTILCLCIPITDQSISHNIVFRLNKYNMYTCYLHVICSGFHKRMD